MRLKLNYEQCNGIYNLIETMLKEYEPENIPESLVDDIVTRIKEKFRKKVFAAYVKDWSITLTIEEAKAYYTFFTRVQATPEGFEYETNLVRAHVNEIDFLYAPPRKHRTQLTSGQKLIPQHG